MTALQDLCDYLNKDEDPRSKRHLLLSSPLLMLSISVAYLLFVLRIGPWFMRHRRPFDLRRALIVYNLVQVVLNFLVMQKGVILLFHERFNIRCMPPLPQETNYFNDAVYEGVYHYLVLKYFDYCDTIFMVLRKKDKQITFLHVFHHIGTSSYVWYVVKYVPGGNTMFSGTLNLFVHVVMYSYYLMTALSPKLAAKFPWKRHITHLQIAQLTVVLLHMSQVLFHNPCGYPLKFTLVFMVNTGSILALFLNYYIKSYSSSKTVSGMTSKKKRK